jgi:putative endonuclease
MTEGLRGAERRTLVKTFYVYILASHTGVLYVGVTNDLERRLFEHRQGVGSAFTSRYRVTRLVFFEAFDTAVDAIAAEKRIKGWSRAKKIALIREGNPSMRDLSEDW